MRNRKLMLNKNQIALLILGSALLAAGCGRKGALETPYQAAVDARREAQRLNKTPVPPEPVKPAEDRPFILDPLL